MRKTSDLIEKAMSAKAGRAAADALWRIGNGAGAYCLGGKIIAGCGIGWFMISFIPIVCKNPASDWMWMWILAAVQLVLGILLVVLCKKSKRFQIWADKDFKRSLDKQAKLEEKVKIGKVTLPVTNGDVLALKICILIIAIIVIALGIGYL